MTTATSKPASPSLWTMQTRKRPTSNRKTTHRQGLMLMMRAKTYKLSLGVAYRNELEHQDLQGGCHRI